MARSAQISAQIDLFQEAVRSEQAAAKVQTKKHLATRDSHPGFPVEKDFDFRDIGPAQPARREDELNCVVPGERFMPTSRDIWQKQLYVAFIEAHKEPFTVEDCAEYLIKQYELGYPRVLLVYAAVRAYLDTLVSKYKILHYGNSIHTYVPVY